MVREDSDEALVRHAQQGDRAAFFALYNRYFNKVFNRVKSKVPAQEAEDVTQEIFIAVLRSLNHFEHRARFSTWLYTIVSRQIANFYRGYYKSAGRVVDLEDNNSIPAVDFDDKRIDEWMIIQRALHCLPKHYQEVIMLRFADGLTFAEIAEQRNKSLEATKSLYRRALQAIRKKVDEPHES